ncbi:MAG: tRNA (adenosine(37)-N6)-threonylcarbamoyltransferase complex ATPase subunit type 1 TsaE [Gemmatimonadetes bacterium]|nr:tRNA (adenosine(37)-N6)-threonylcarbamoyltransferase complex ATPase subunit type 1 TsaE [Gemmatimonadota bacterium]
MSARTPPPRALSREELDAWGADFGASLRAPAVVALTGELGAGKTTLAQAICRGYGVAEPVTSPTFTLVHEYAAPRSPVYHLDLYRLASEPALDSIGIDEILAQPAVVLVEWAERARERLPAGARHLVLAHDAGDPSRRLLTVG